MSGSDEQPIVVDDRHSIGYFGVLIFGVGLALQAGAFLLPSAFPNPPEAASLNLDAYRADLDRVGGLIKTRMYLAWAADLMIPGGFLMWLAGRVVDALRFPGKY